MKKGEENVSQPRSWNSYWYSWWLIRSYNRLSIVISTLCLFYANITILFRINNLIVNVFQYHIGRFSYRTFRFQQRIQLVAIWRFRWPRRRRSRSIHKTTFLKCTEINQKILRTKLWWRIERRIFEDWW